jgi:hypothetical protein
VSVFFRGIASPERPLPRAEFRQSIGYTRGKPRFGFSRIDLSAEDLVSRLLGLLSRVSTTLQFIEQPSGPGQFFAKLGKLLRTRAAPIVSHNLPTQSKKPEKIAGIKDSNQGNRLKSTYPTKNTSQSFFFVPCWEKITLQ